MYKLFSYPLLKKLFFFAVSGFCGLLTDMAVLSLLIFLGLGEITARIPAITAATIVTFFINRHFTFAASPSSLPLLKAYSRYFALSWLGVAVNFICYTFVITFFEMHYIAALIFATLISMSINFLSYNRFVFSGKKSKSHKDNKA